MTYEDLKMIAYIAYNPKKKIWAEVRLPYGLFYYWQNPITRKIIAETATWHHGKPPREPTIYTDYPDMPDMVAAKYIEQALGYKGKKGKKG